MRLLAIDTSGKVAGAALMQDGLLVCETNLAAGRTHSERLMPIVDGCFALAGWKPADIDAVAAVAGPGSFTGIRIGVSAAKGIAAALGIPAVAVNTLEALAASFPGFGGVVVPMLDARREQVYCAVYDGNLEELLPPIAMHLEELLRHPGVAGAPMAMFAGDGAAALAGVITGALGARAAFAPPHLMLQRAGAAASVAYRKALAGETMDAAALRPIYLRKSQAEQLREARECAHGL